MIQEQETDSIATMVIVPMIAICLLFCALTGLCWGYKWKFVRLQRIQIEQRNMEWDICAETKEFNENNLEIEMDTFVQAVSNKYSISDGTVVQISRVIPSNVKV